MSEYYAVQRSDNSLKHYGVRGMKWGVRKALQKGSARGLSKQYKKATKKLAKLNLNADRKKQMQNAQKLNKIAKKSLKVGLGGVAGNVGATLIGERHQDDAFNLFKRYVAQTKGGKQVTNGLKNQMNRVDKKILTNSRIQAATGLIGMAGLGVAAGAKASAIAAKHRASDKGHAKAVAKRNAFKKEMQDAFKNTKIKELPKSKANKNKVTSTKKKERKYFTKEDFKNAAKAAGLSLVMGPGAATYMSAKKAANSIPANNNRHGKKRKRV